MELMINVAVINFVDGSPDPSCFNDAMEIFEPQDTVLFDWVDLEGGDSKTHYVVLNETAHQLGTPEEVVNYIGEAMMATNSILREHPNAYGVHEYNRRGITKLDLDVDDGMVQFQTTKLPGIWIHAIWRS